MYDTLIMLKSNADFSVDELLGLVADVMQSELVGIERVGSGVRVLAGSGSLDIGWNDAAHVLEESNEIASGSACRRTAAAHVSSRPATNRTWSCLMTTC